MGLILILEMLESISEMKHCRGARVQKKNFFLDYSLRGICGLGKAPLLLEHKNVKFFRSLYMINVSFTSKLY